MGIRHIQTRYIPILLYQSTQSGTSPEKVTFVSSSKTIFGNLFGIYKFLFWGFAFVFIGIHIRNYTYISNNIYKPHLEYFLLFRNTWGAFQLMGSKVVILEKSALYTKNISNVNSHTHHFSFQLLEKLEILQIIKNIYSLKPKS